MIQVPKEIKARKSQILGKSITAIEHSKWNREYQKNAITFSHRSIIIGNEIRPSMGIFHIILKESKKMCITQPQQQKDISIKSGEKITAMVQLSSNEGKDLNCRGKQKQIRCPQLCATVICLREQILLSALLHNTAENQWMFCFYWNQNKLEIVRRTHKTNKHRERLLCNTKLGTIWSSFCIVTITAQLRGLFSNVEIKQHNGEN